jgi:hypothetical protein
MFADKQLAWAALGLAALTTGVISVSAPVVSAQSGTVVPAKPWSHNLNNEFKPQQPKLHYILPPVEFDHYYEGDLTIKVVPDLISLRAACSNEKENILACAWHNSKSCVIYMVEDRVMRERGWTTGLLLRHEIGHCNGWPGDHPGQRGLTAPSTHWVPAHERINR